MKRQWIERSPGSCFLALMLLWLLPAQVNSQVLPGDRDRASCSVLSRDVFPPARGGERCEPEPTPFPCKEGAVVRCLGLHEVCGASAITDAAEFAMAHAQCRGQRRTCQEYPVGLKMLDGACMAFVSVPEKGGGNQSVKSAEPACGAGFGDHSRCQSVGVVPPPRHRIKPGSVKFLVKESHPTACDDPVGYVSCEPGQGGESTVDCPVSWSKWSPIAVDRTAAGRFKNWSHDRRRCAAVRIEFEPERP